MHLAEHDTPAAEPASRGPAAASRLARPAAAVAAAALALAAYWPSFHVPLVYDDEHLILEPRLHARSLAPDQLLRAAEGFPLQRWLAYVSFAANHAIHGLSPAGYHVVNLLVHGAVVALLALLAGRLLRAAGVADEGVRDRARAIAALLFAVHPVHTMAVTYVIQRMTSLGALLALASLSAWLAARRDGALRRGPAAAALLLWYLAVACKENYAVLPGIVLLVEWISGTDLRAALGRRRTFGVAALLVAVALGALAAARYWPVIEREQLRFGVSVGDRLLSQPRVLWHYLSLLALPLPSRLHVDYAYPASTGLLSPPTTLLALAGLAALVAVAVLARRRHPLLALATGWFLVALAVEQSVLPIDLVFEHRLYFASVGAFVLTGHAIATRLPGRAAWLVALPLAAVLAFGTRLRNEVWRDPARLFADAASVGAGKADALVNASVALRQRGDLDEAERVLHRAIALEPWAPQAYANLGNVAVDRGRADEAERWYREALRRDRRNAEVLYNLGVLLADQGRREEAAAAYEEAVAASPDHSDARVNLALLVDHAGDRPRALALLDEVLARDPGSALALMNRALFHAEAGRAAEALSDAREALRFAPEDPNAHFVMADVHRRAGRTGAAREAAHEALRRDPGHADARRLLGQIER